jgi:hypothetical protein
MKMKLSRMGRSLRALAAMLLCVASSQTLAAGFSFTGSFSSDDGVFSVPFGLISSQSVTLRTWSYAGGTNAAGASIPAGGFDPIVSVFNSAGHIVGISDDGIGVATDPVSGAAHDSLLTLVLGAGNYLAVLTQYDNFPNGDFLADGLSEAGQGSFTAAFGCGAPRFCDEGFARTGNFALDILGVNAVPEPATLALVLAGLAGLRVNRRRSAS